MKELRKCKVLVTPRSFGTADPTLFEKLNELVGEVIINPYGRVLTAQDLIPLVQDVDGIIAGLDEYSEEVINCAPQLKVISRYGVGYDHVDLESAKANNVIVTNTPGANSSSVAELTVGLMIMLLRKITSGVNAIRHGEFPKVSGNSLSNKTVGLMGFGAIGREVAKRLSGFNCRIIAYDPYLTQADVDKYDVELLEFLEVLNQSDIISLHLPVTNDTRLLVNNGFFNSVKTGAYLINTARGELIDDNSLIDALSSGKLAGAAVDVYSKEPPEEDFALFKLENALCTPHMAAHTDEAINQMGWGAMKACIEVLQGKSPKNRII